MRLRVAEADVWANGQLEQGRHHRTDRDEKQGHRVGRILGDLAKGRAPSYPAPRDDGFGGDVSRQYPMRARNGQSGAFYALRFT
jgi:hypothetical protein